VNKARSWVANESNVGTELEAMLPLGPGNIVDKSVHRGLVVAAPNQRQTRVVRRAVVIQSAEEDEWLSVVVAVNADALACVPVTKVVEQSGPKGRRIAYGEAPAQIRVALDWAGPRKIRNQGMRVIANSPTPEQSVGAALGQLVIRARDIPVIVGGRGAAEAKAYVVHSISGRHVIRLRESIQVAHHDRIRPDMKRVHRGDLAGVKRIVASAN